MKKIAFDFFMDRLAFIIGYFINSFVIALFFYLSTGKVVEIVYPLGISTFIFIIIVLIQWFGYYPFLWDARFSVSNPYYDLRAVFREHKALADIINHIHSTHLSRIDEMHKENQDQSYFLSQWVHNMKTPASIIDIIIQKYEKGQLEEKDAIEDIHIENDKMLEGLEQVLSVVRLGNFSNDYAPECVDLVAEIRKLVNIKRRHFIYNRIFPKIQSEKEKVLVLTDSKWNSVMVEQLISNAVKYSSTEEEGKSILFQIAQHTDYTTLTIKDQGIGIPGHDLKRIFEPFFTGENGRKVKNATGIGLYVCFLISEKLGHKLTVKSEPGAGTEVTITYLTKV